MCPYNSLSSGPKFPWDQYCNLIVQYLVDESPGPHHIDVVLEQAGIRVDERQKEGLKEYLKRSGVSSHNLYYNPFERTIEMNDKAANLEPSYRSDMATNDGWWAPSASKERRAGTRTEVSDIAQFVENLGDYPASNPIAQRLLEDIKAGRPVPTLQIVRAYEGVNGSVANRQALVNQVNSKVTLTIYLDGEQVTLIPKRDGRGVGWVLENSDSVSKMPKDSLTDPELEELKALIARLNLFVGGDSYPINNISSVISIGPSLTDRKRPTKREAELFKRLQGMVKSSERNPQEQKQIFLKLGFQKTAGRSLEYQR